ncbi:MAG TPA: hypothetical protein VFP72_05655 [Kineosporiaceae bacterium]|nr:hypothetical protein [Kineosporiaceae bacterium]
MADGYGADLAVAREVAQSLAEVRSALNGLGTQLTTGVTGSPKVEAALARFFHETSDNRQAMDELLQRGVAMMQALIDGTRAVDQGLADSLTTTGPAATATAGSSAPTPGRTRSAGPQ